jgi:hypothetical protein
MCSSNYGNKDSYFLAIKSTHIFVYEAEDSDRPLFAVDLEGVSAISEDDNKVYIIVPYAGISFTFTFTDNTTTEGFMIACNSFARIADVDSVKRRLKHSTIMSRRESTRYAVEVGKECVKKQQENVDKEFEVDCVG